MPFSNVWDTTFPPDTQLANLLGQDLRNFRLDVQQRMGSISGLDAAKPPFNTDAQPANWNGVLFFATDTHKIYQWVNPAWNDITANFIFQTSAQKAVNLVNHTGTTTLDTIYTLNIPANQMGASGRVRMTLYFTISAIAGNNSLLISFGGTNLGSILNVPIAAGTNRTCRLVLEGGNTGATNSQRWNGHLYVSTLTPIQFALNNTSAIDTTLAVAVNALWQSSAVGDSQTFYSFTLEVF